MFYCTTLHKRLSKKKIDYGVAHGGTLLGDADMSPTQATLMLIFVPTDHDSHMQLTSRDLLSKTYFGCQEGFISLKVATHCC